MIIEKSAGAIIFYLDEQKPIYLLLHYPTYLGFVKGLIEKNEKSEETVKREAKEEANISELKIIPGFKKTLSYIFKLHGKLIRKWVVFLFGEITKQEAARVKVSWEHQGFKWLPYEEALKLLKHKNEIEIFKKANEFLKNYLKQKKLIQI